MAEALAPSLMPRSPENSGSSAGNVQAALSSPSTSSTAESCRHGPVPFLHPKLLIVKWKPSCQVPKFRSARPWDSVVPHTEPSSPVWATPVKSSHASRAASFPPQGCRSRFHLELVSCAGQLLYESRSIHPTLTICAPTDSSSLRSRASFDLLAPRSVRP